MGNLPKSVGPYRIARLLGEGGMGAVYEAHQEPLDRRVALKILHPEYARNQEAVSRFFNEAKVLSKLEHPSIVQVFDFGHAPDGTTYLVMEYLRGQSLANRLRHVSGRNERLSTVTTLQFAWQIADVLAVAHAQGIVHRDLKPENLMLVADPVAPGGERVKILDFGIAKLTKSSDRGSVKTDTQAVMGTPMYMSPEQCAGAGGVDDRTDVYSLGCLLYEMFAGRPPFVAEGAGQLIGMHLFREPSSLAEFAPKLPPKVIELVHLLLTKNKAQRPTMSTVADDIGKLLVKLSSVGAVVRSRPRANTDPDATRTIPIAPGATTLGKSIGQWGRPSPRSLPLLLIGAVGLVLVAILGVVFRNGRQPVTPLQAAASPPATLPATARTTEPEFERPEPVEKIIVPKVEPLPATRPTIASKPTTSLSPTERREPVPAPQPTVAKPELRRLLQGDKAASPSPAPVLAIKPALVAKPTPPLRVDTLASSSKPPQAKANPANKQPGPAGRVELSAQPQPGPRPSAAAIRILLHADE